MLFPFFLLCKTFGTIKKKKTEIRADNFWQLRIYVCVLYVSYTLVKCRTTIELAKQRIQKIRYRDMYIHPMYKFCCYSYKCAFSCHLLLCDTLFRKKSKDTKKSRKCTAFEIAFTEMKRYFIFSWISYTSV